MKRNTECTPVFWPAVFTFSVSKTCRHGPGDNEFSTAAVTPLYSHATGNLNGVAVNEQIQLKGKNRPFIMSVSSLYLAPDSVSPSSGTDDSAGPAG